MRFINITQKDFKYYIWSIIRGVLLVGISCIILYPFFIKISSSFMTERDIYDLSVKWIPRNFTYVNYIRAWTGLYYPQAFLNSFILTLSVSILQLFSCTIVGYGFARYSFRGMGFLFGLVILTLIVPPQLIMIPIYLNFRFFNFFGLIGESGFNLLNSYWPFILTSLTATGMRNGLFIFIMRQFFKGMPRGLEEAAKVDGAGPLKVFFRVMLPGAAPAILIVFLFSFVWQWNDTFYTNLYLAGGKFLPFTLNSLAINFNQMYQ
ncbi:MAG: carbohydrate ABC transporter permease, partial [Halanaerobiales bacterium]